MPYKQRFITLALLAVASLATSQAQTSSCRDDAVTAEGIYPEHQLSPQESLRQHDTVFLGEVVVPPRPCSLGYCAGLKVLRTLKGEPGQTALVRITRPAPDACGPATFKSKGSRWMVFANTGTSKTGYRYLQAATDGPSFAASSVPDFKALEGRYRALRARLDEAIDQRLGRLR